VKSIQLQLPYFLLPWPTSFRSKRGEDKELPAGSDSMAFGQGFLSFYSLPVTIQINIPTNYHTFLALDFHSRTRNLQLKTSLQPIPYLLKGVH